MKAVFTLIMACCGLCGLTQDSIPVYFDADLNPTSRRNAAFNGTMVQNGEGVWDVVANYPGGQPLLAASYKDKRMRVRHGVMQGYFPNGQKRLSATFDNNVLEGVYTVWHESGHMADSGRLASNAKTGIWKTWYANGVLESEGTYTAGIPDGNWKWFHENGNPATVEIYQNSKLKDLSCFNESGTPTGFNCRLDKKPAPKGAYSFESYVIENLMYPEEALKKRVEGVVEFEFFVTKEGKLTRINFQNQGNRLLHDAVVNFLKAVPEWEPAISHNRKVDCLYTYSIPFYLP